MNLLWEIFSFSRLYLYKEVQMSDNSNLKYLQQLAKKVIAGKATEEEILFLEEYYNAFEKHSEVETELSGKDLEELQKTVLQKISRETTDEAIPDISRKPIWRWMAAAAILIISMGGIIYTFYNKKNEAVAKTPESKTTNEILPGSNKATLTLNNDSTILLDDVAAGSLARQGNMLVNKTNDDKLVYTSTGTQTSPEKIEYNTVRTPKGGQYQVLLPDGTKVWLNAASSIHFPTSFTENQREVNITGELYFEVAHDAKRPFIVHSGNTSVQVLGTHFNIMGYDNEEALRATLIQGSIKISKENKTALLHPGEQMQVNEKIFKLVKNADVDAELAWKNGLFNFKDAGIEAIMKQVERWYNITVKFEGDLPEKQFNGMVPRNVTLVELMEILSFYDDMQSTIDGTTITIKRK